MLQELHDWAGVGFRAESIALEYQSWWAKGFGTGIPHYVGVAGQGIYPVAIPMLVGML